MNLEFLQHTDAKLLELLENKSTTREARREITRRKAVGSWRLIAGWKSEIHAEAEEETDERVYAPGVKRVVT